MQVIESYFEAKVMNEGLKFNVNYRKLPGSETSQWRFIVSMQILESYLEVKLHNGL